MASNKADYDQISQQEAERVEFKAPSEAYHTTVSDESTDVTLYHMLSGREARLPELT